jgi:choline dehydrogenase-like flavoprotein
LIAGFTGGRGILSSSGAHAAGAISSTEAKSRGEGHWPDLVLYLFGFSVFRTYASVFGHAFNLKVDEQAKYNSHAIGKESFLMVVSGARPLSKGYLKLGGPSPYDKLVIDPNYLNDPGNVDIKAMVEGIKTTVTLVENSTALGQDFGGHFTSQLYPGCEHLPFRTDAYWECFARRTTITLHHPGK